MCSVSVGSPTLCCFFVTACDPLLGRLLEDSEGVPREVRDRDGGLVGVSKR